ncbi:MAG: phosphoethanolamine transferase, partial [Candidatus Fonsibacter ubiquis]|nr:phosphoethanolamine transferase [Candidatus Fonsibacter ubiquis]
MVGIVVVGETARADHFSLNGYSRKTNPKLEKQNLSNFNNAYSCGTLTKTSVPCMFYVGDYASFDVAKANQRANLLDIITASGVAVTWFNNNSGCKHVCDQVKTIDLTKIYSEEQYDEQLIIELDKILDNNKSKKTLLVLHSMGSHGPKYYKRYPKEFDKFQPSCKNNNPQECSKEELINAYDNTILYTDHFLDLLINKLKKQNKKSFLIYASDHGESLG